MFGLFASAGEPSIKNLLIYRGTGFIMGLAAGYIINTFVHVKYNIDLSDLGLPHIKFSGPLLVNIPATSDA